MSDDGGVLPGEPGGSWYTWWRGDVLPPLPPLAGFHAEVVSEPARAAALTRVSIEEARARAGQEHRAYAAYMRDEPVGWGWLATREASIGELGLTFQLPPGNCYLWSFETVPAWRGRGVYHHLLQYIIAHEMAKAERFWIGHEPGNRASARGILQAGFDWVGELAIAPDGKMWLVAVSQDLVRVRAGAAILDAEVWVGG